MVLVIQFLQPFALDVGVYLRSAYVGVSQHGLDRPKVRIVFQQMSGKGVAQNVGADFFAFYASLGRVQLEKPPQLLARQALSPPSHKQGRAFWLQ
jgi:hypothetical protein